MISKEVRLHVTRISYPGCARLQQEHKEREFERKILEAAREKEMREKQVEQEERLAKVCLTHKGWGGVKRDQRSPFLELTPASESGEKADILPRREELSATKAVGH